MTLKLGVVMDPIESIHVKKDSTFAMLLEAQARRWEIHYMQQADLFVRDGEAMARTRSLDVYSDRTHGFNSAATAPSPCIRWMRS